MRLWGEFRDGGAGIWGDLGLVTLGYWVSIENCVFHLL